MNREDKGFKERIKVNIESYPFDADEMLLKLEFGDKAISKKRDDSNRRIRRLGDNPFDAEEMLLNSELREMDEER